MINKFPIPSSWQFGADQCLALFSDKTAFVFDASQRLAYDLSFELDQESLHFIFNDDASWADLALSQAGDHWVAQGIYKSYLKESKQLHWELKPHEMLQKPQAKTLLQAVRFADGEKVEALGSLDSDWNAMLIEAATCGHEHLFSLLIDKGALVNPDQGASMALTKAIQYGHVRSVKSLLDLGANIHHDHFDLDRDNFYHACFLYQIKPKAGERVLRMMLEYGVDLISMSAYYLTAVMTVYPHDPRSEARSDTNMLELLLDRGTPMNDFLTITATQKDTPFMYAAHMGLIEPMKLLHDRGADIFATFEGQSAYDRWAHPVIVDALMPCQGAEEIGTYLYDLGLRLSAEEVVIEPEAETEKKSASIEDLENLFT